MTEGVSGTGLVEPAGNPFLDGGLASTNLSSA